MKDIIKMYDAWINLDLRPFQTWNASYSASEVLKLTDLAQYKSQFEYFYDDMLDTGEPEKRVKTLQSFNVYIENR